MNWFRRLTSSEPAHKALCWLAAVHIHLVYATGRWRVLGGDIPRRLWQERKPFILCFWHGRLLMMPYCWKRSVPIHMLISQHRDGQIIARTVSHFRIDTIAGSSSRGGSAALRAMVRALKSGDCIGITPDGPRGPRMRASDGIVSVARLAGVPVVPVAFSASPRTLLSSWDRFLIAWPFGRGVFVWGEPISVAPHASPEEMEEARLLIERRLNDVTRDADRLCGRQPVEAGPAAAGGQPPDPAPATAAAVRGTPLGPGDSE